MIADPVREILDSNRTKVMIMELITVEWRSVQLKIVARKIETIS